MASPESDCLLPVVHLSTLFTSSRDDTGQEHLEASEGKMAIVGHLPTVIVRSAEFVALCADSLFSSNCKGNVETVSSAAAELPPSPRVVAMSANLMRVTGSLGSDQ